MRVLWTGLKMDMKQIGMGYIKLILFAVSVIVLCLAIGVAGSQILYKDKAVEPFGLAIVDHEDSQWTKMIIEAVEQMETVTRLCEIQVTDEMKAKSMLSSGEVAAVITIPDHFVYDAMVGTNTPLIVEKHEGTMVEGIVVDKLITSATKLLSAAQAGIYATLDGYNAYGDQNPEHYDKLLQEINLIFAKKMLARNSMFIEKEVVATGKLNPLVHYLFSGFIVLMTLSLLLVMQIIEPLNQSEMLMRYKVAKVKGRWLILEKFSALFSFVMVFGGISLAGIVIGIKRIDEKVVWEFGLSQIGAGILAVGGLAAMGVLIGMLLKEREAYGLFIFAIVMVQAFLAGGLVPEAFLPQAINKLGYFTYNKYALDLLGSFTGASVEKGCYLGMSIVILSCLGVSLMLLKKRGIKG